MKSDVLNVYDLAIAREIIPLIRLRLRILKSAFTRSSANGRKRILIVAPCVVGDCLSYLPVIEEYAEENDTTYDIVVSPDFRSLAERLRRVSRVFVASSSYNRVTERQGRSAQELPPEYDLMIVLRLSPDAFNLIRQVRCSRIVSSDSTLLRYLIHLAKSSLLGQPVIQSRDTMYGVLGVKARPGESRVPTVFRLGPHDDDNLKQLPEIQGHEKKVLIHTGSGWQVKLWSDDRWVDLLKRINSLDPSRFVFIGRGDVEKSAFERIQERLDFKVYSLINSLTLWELFLTMRRSDCFIGVDSGPRNLAHLADLRSVTLLNPAAVKNFMPFDERDIVVEKQNRYPANIINTRRGAKLSDISVEEVFEAYRVLLTRLPVASYHDKSWAQGLAREA